MRKEINLHFNSIHRGPGKVVENLARGLQEIGWSITANHRPEVNVYQGCLQPTSQIHDLPSSTLMGPNLFVLPSEWGNFCHKFNKFIVPSMWVKNLYRTYGDLNHASIDVWPVGIDTNSWSPPSYRKTERVLIYLKNRSDNVLKGVIEELGKSQIPHEIIRYGAYKEEELHEACNRCKYCILLTNTESQGIAYMQILSAGLPCYVINKDYFDDTEYHKNNPILASSVPYFDNKCGIKSDIFDMNQFHIFMKNFHNFNPSEYIHDNFSLKKCAQSYIDILLR